MGIALSIAAVVFILSCAGSVGNCISTNQQLKRDAKQRWYAERADADEKLRAGAKKHNYYYDPIIMTWDKTTNYDGTDKCDGRQKYPRPADAE